MTSIILPMLPEIITLEKSDSEVEILKWSGYIDTINDQLYSGM